MLKAAALTNIWPAPPDVSSVWPTQADDAREHADQAAPLAVRKSAPGTAANASPALALPKMTSAAGPKNMFDPCDVAKARSAEATAAPAKLPGTPQSACRLTLATSV